MGKALFIAEKPSVAQEFAKALKVSGRKGDGYIESDQAIVTWCVGHLVDHELPGRLRSGPETLEHGNSAVSPKDIQIPGDRRCKKTI